MVVRGFRILRVLWSLWGLIFKGAFVVFGGVAVLCVFFSSGFCGLSAEE